MSTTKILGALLIASPFLGIAIFVVLEAGWKVMLGIYGSVIAVLGIIWLGIFLLNAA